MAQKHINKCVEFETELNKLLCCDKIGSHASDAIYNNETFDVALARMGIEVV